MSSCEVIPATINFSKQRFMLLCFHDHSIEFSNNKKITGADNSKYNIQLFNNSRIVGFLCDNQAPFEITASAFTMTLNKQAVQTETWPNNSSHHCNNF